MLILLLRAKSGLIVDGTFVEVPRQRNSKDENKQIKNGEVPERIASNPHVLAQKDLDAEWAKKGNDTFYGFKNHVAGDGRIQVDSRLRRDRRGDA